jgi:signal transduction histidine kinase
MTIRFLISLAVTTACFLPWLTAEIPVKEVRRVLIFNTYGPLSSPGVALMDRAIVDGLGRAPYQIELYSENLETTLFPDEEIQREFLEWSTRKYRDRKPDVIIAVGREPLKLLVEEHEKTFPGVPIVFCGSTKEMLDQLKLDSSFTGVWGVAEPEKTLIAALRLRPSTKHVVVVGGVGAYDRELESIVKKALHGYESKLKFTYLTDLDMPTLLERLKRLPNDSIVYHTSLMQDAAGTRFIDASQSVPLIASAANAPVFVVDDVDLGKGTVGGDLLSFDVEGRAAAAMAVKVLNGERPGNIPIVESPNAYMFDWLALQRWGLNESDLPRGSIVLNRQPTLWEQYRSTLLIGLLALASLSLLTIDLLFERKQLHAARTEQMRLSGMLINAQEDERARLASELHDDFSQRLAILSLGLEAVAETVPESPAEANRQLNALMNSASELGADLHTLSHRLHSSTLKQLGLTVGVGAFCEEFTAQRGIQVEFSHKDVPPSVPPDISLCMFRIVQEALRNVQKHSGAAHAQVRIEAMDETLHLSISDDGAGYDVNNGAGRQGLGLRSMRERVRLVGGRFEIHSKTRKGTRIDVWAPLTIRPGTPCPPDFTH